MRAFQKPFKLYAGRHTAKFMGVDNGVGAHGPYLLWKYCITYGHHRTPVTRITGQRPTEGSHCEFMLRNMLGRSGTDMDLSEINSLIEMPFTIMVQYHKGYPRVEAVWPMSGQE
jgi:hypothetical protein